MVNPGSTIAALSLLGTFELILRNFTYIAAIIVALKAIQALNVYINKNNRP